jgi:hypothetical protein
MEGKSFHSSVSLNSPSSPSIQATSFNLSKPRFLLPNLGRGSDQVSALRIHAFLHNPSSTWLLSSKSLFDDANVPDG